MRGDLKKIKILFTGMVGPYREILTSRSSDGMLFGSYSGYFAQSIRHCRTRSSSKRIGLRSMFCLKIPVYRDGKRGETPLTLFDKSFVTDLTVHVDVVSDEAPSLSPNIVCVWWPSCFVPKIL
jgi:hypothetical protein